MEGSPSAHRMPPRRQGRGRGSGDRASGTVISYIVGIGVFFVVFAIAVSYMGIISKPATSKGDIDLDSKARNTLEVLTGSPGVPSDWEENPSNLKRLGLLKPGSEITVAESKLAELQPGGGVSYSDAKDALGLDHHEFDLETQPKWDGDDNRTSLDGYRVAYVGRFDGGETDASKAESGTLTETSVSFTNSTPDGSTVGADPADKAKDNWQHASAHLITQLAGLPYNEDDGSLVTSSDWWNITDTEDHSSTLRPDHRNVLHTSSLDGGSWSYTDSVDSDDDRIYVTRVNLSDYDNSDSVWFNFSHHADGTGGVTPDKGVVQTRKADDTTDAWEDESSEFSSVGGINDFQNESVEITDAKGDDVYIALLWRTNGDGDGGNGWFVSNWTVEAVKDGDHKLLVNNTLDYNTTVHDALVVGKDVEGGQLAHGQVKQGIRQWIKAGGDLLGLAPHHSSREYLKDWVTGSQLRDVGPLTVDEEGSNTSHPYLNALHTLDYESWEWDDDVWGVDADDPFTWIIRVEDDNGDYQPGLAITDHDAPGDGNIILTSKDATSMSKDQRRNNFENALNMARYRNLYVQLGSEPSGNHTVGSAKAVTLVDHDGQGLNHPNFEVFVDVWK